MRAHAFALAARDGHPDDARQLATALLIDLSAGMPTEHVFGSVREDARWWAGRATPVELVEVMAAALDRLRDRALHSDMRKRLFMALWRNFSDVERQRFLAMVNEAQP